MNEIEDFLSKEDLKKDLNFLIEKIKEYFKNYNIEYDISLELFQDYFDKSWKIVNIKVKLFNVQEYIAYYLLTELRRFALSMDKNKRKKIIITFDG